MSVRVFGDSVLNCAIQKQGPAAALIEGKLFAAFRRIYDSAEIEVLVLRQDWQFLPWNNRFLFGIRMIIGWISLSSWKRQKICRFDGFAGTESQCAKPDFNKAFHSLSFNIAKLGKI